MVAALTSGPSADLIGQLSTTRLAGGGYLQRLCRSGGGRGPRCSPACTPRSISTFPRWRCRGIGELNLKLNVAPSFRNPKSVLVIGLPAVESPQFAAGASGRSQRCFLPGESFAGAAGGRHAVAVLHQSGL